MTDNTIFLQRTSDQRLLARYYSLADTFVICSKRENFPTTCLEAQCCGTPIAGFDVGGTKETSIGGTMNFVPFGDLDGLKASVGRAMEEDRELTASVARRLFSKETMIENHLREYDRGGRKERILLIDVNCKHSSTGKIVYDLFQGIKKDGRDARICYGRGENINEEGIYKFGLDWETNIHAGLARITGYNGYFSPISTYRLIQSIEEYKPNLIHIHELHAYFVNLRPLIEYIKKKKIPVVYTFHCEYTYTGKCGYANECTNFINECGNCPELHEYPKSLFFDRTKQMLKMKKREFGDLEMTIITPSKWLANRVKLSFLKNKRIDVIHNGINTNVFHPVDASELRTELKIPADHKVVLSVAPDIMSERKGGKWVLKLAEMMKKEKVTFVLVGVGGVVHTIISNNTRLIGAIGEQEILAEYYSLADVFLLCSRKETYSMTCAEALCCGTPIVGFQCGVPETIFLNADFVRYGHIKELYQVLLAKLGGVRVSVAMAVYNGEKYIDEQIESILRMMNINDELVISYEESADATLDIIREYERTDERVKVVFDNGHSVESNFNNAVKNCTGRYIFLSDQDDVWMANKINKMVEYFEADPSITVIISDGYLTDAELNKTGTIYNTYRTKANPILNFAKGTYLGCQMAFDCRIKDYVWPVRVSPPLPHDLWLGVAGARYGKVKMISDKLILHRLHDSNYSNTSKMNIKNVIKNRLLFLSELIKRR